MDRNNAFNPFRIIPNLQVDNRRLVKTSKFKKPIYVGDLINNLRIFNDKEVDEIVVSDITATREGRKPDFGFIYELASECFMPLAYGGGIKSTHDIEKIIQLGVEKVVINTAAIENTQFIQDAANAVGSQSVVVSVDVKRGWFGKGYSVYTRSGTKKIPLDLTTVIDQVTKAGAGEVLLNMIDYDGLNCGYDHSLIETVCACTSLPVIASGGASGVKDLVHAVKHSGASAVAAGAIFIYKGPHRAVLINYPKSKDIHSYL